VTLADVARKSCGDGIYRLDAMLSFAKRRYAKGRIAAAVKSSGPPPGAGLKTSTIKRISDLRFIKLCHD